MRLVDAASAADYLRSAGHVSGQETVHAQELSGGVSNVVILVTLPGRGERFILKQARQRLRVKEEWLCPPERIWREVETLRACGELLQSGDAINATRPQGVADGESIRCRVPEVLWEDRENYAYAMTAAPEGHRTWKEVLLAEADETSFHIAGAWGRRLAAIHAGSWHLDDYERRFGDRSYFLQLRVDPYYRQIARVHIELASPIEHLIASLEQNRLSLVHGDFSPKNMLVWAGHVMLIDFEVGHYGDPAFDLGFFLTHLILKRIRAENAGLDYLALAANFWGNYRHALLAAASSAALEPLEHRTLLNLAGCMLARVDGKSPVDYLTPRKQELVRRHAIRWLRSAPASLSDALGQLV
jgi:aminoglycoside phosphotransferase (APT) family kinase protein